MGTNALASSNEAGVSPSRCTRYSSNAVAGVSEAYTPIVRGEVHRPPRSLPAPENGVEACRGSITRYTRNSSPAWPAWLAGTWGWVDVAVLGLVCEGGSLAGKLSAMASSRLASSLSSTMGALLLLRAEG